MQGPFEPKKYMADGKASNNELINSGLLAVGKVPWGTHFCQFYKTQKDLSGTLVPYFKAGLENNEFCVWVTSEFLTRKEALEALEKGVSNFSKYLKKGQIEIFPYTQWYLKEGKFELKRVLKNWIKKYRQGSKNGFKGMRVSGNPFWIDNKKDWDDFAAYEAEINNVIGPYKLLVLCTYSLEKCHASEVIDVVKNHEFALIKKSDNWELIETAEQKRTKQELYQRESQLKTVFERQKNFFTVVGHELGNLITPIILSLSFLKKKQIEDPSVKHTLEMINHRIQNMSDLVKDLLDVSRIEGGNIKLNKKKVNISSTIKSSAELVKPLIDQAKQKLEISLPLKPIMLYADTLRLEQILINLLNNASKYSKEKGKIKLNAEKKNGLVFIKIKDEGMGIPKDFLPKVFELFIRGKSQGRTKEGLGIGLYFSRELVRLHGGDVFAESSGRGKGSEFIVKIPIKN